MSKNKAKEQFYQNRLKSQSLSKSRSDVSKSSSGTSSSSSNKLHSLRSESMSSDFEDWEEEEGEEEVKDWLDSDEDEKNIEEQQILPVVQEEERESATNILTPEQKDIYDVLLQVADLRYTTLPFIVQVKLIETIVVKRYVVYHSSNLLLFRYSPGDVIISEGDNGGDFYIVVGPDNNAQVEVVRLVNGPILLY